MAKMRFVLTEIENENEEIKELAVSGAVILNPNDNELTNQVREGYPKATHVLPDSLAVEMVFNLIVNAAINGAEDDSPSDFFQMVTGNIIDVINAGIRKGNELFDKDDDRRMVEVMSIPPSMQGLFNALEGNTLDSEDFPESSESVN